MKDNEGYIPAAEVPGLCLFGVLVRFGHVWADSEKGLTPHESFFGHAFNFW